ncbi:DUF1129 domain-containing protein [Anaerovorax odorimutans]|uniref:hypothetical protein n=1 Tax=Anaerovorax odorimutans TaxID=109327 RepID=UPI000410A17B|nr:hypothetical protein [Anaerovorax odorimutans]
MNKQTRELNRINNELNKQVNYENKEAFTDIVCYLRGANISEYNQELIRQDLLEMILSAQKRSEDIKAVIGEDYKVFCDNIIENLPPRTIKEKFLNFIDIICWCISILSAINIIISNDTISLIRNLIKGGPVNFQLSVSIGNVISAVIIVAAAFIIVETILKNSFKIGKNKSINKVKVFLICASIMAIFLLIAWLGKTTLFTVNIFTACTFTLILYIIHKILSRIQ